MQDARELWVPHLCLVQRNPGSGRVWRPSGYAAPIMAARSKRYRSREVKSHLHNGKGGLRASACACRIPPQRDGGAGGT